MAHSKMNPTRWLGKRSASTTSEPLSAAEFDKRIEELYGTKPGGVIDMSSPFLSALAAMSDPETEPPQRYTPEQLSSGYYSPNGEPITEVEYLQLLDIPKYQPSGTYVAGDGQGGRVETIYHGYDQRDRPTQPMPWSTLVYQRGEGVFSTGVLSTAVAWPDEETALRGHHAFIRELHNAGAVEFLRTDTLDAIHKNICEPDKPF